MNKFSNFNYIAPIYDFLARLIFGNSLKRSQLHFLKIIPENSNILILGGGSGWILTELLQLKPDCTITYVEASSEMLRLTKEKLRRKKLHEASIQLIQDENYLSKDHHSFDVVITNFFLDLFDEKNLADIISSIKNHLKPDGLWLLSDFDCNECGASFFRKLLVRIMYFFFRLTTGLKTTQLLDYEKGIRNLGFQRKNSKSFYFRMIRSSVFKT